MKTKTLIVVLATLLIGGFCFWACQKEIPLEDELDLKTLQDDLAKIGPDDYIVVFKSEVTDVPGLARQLAARHNGEISHIYQYAIKGFAATLSSDAVEALRNHPQIAWIEADQMAWTFGAQSEVSEKTGSQTGDIPWGLDRIDQRNLPLDNTYNYNQTGNIVSVYIIGTGIRFTHNEFLDENGKSRAVPGFDYRGDGWDTSDNGRGTSLASVVGGNTYGVAKKATLVSVRVLGPGPTMKNIIAGVDWVTLNHNKPAVAFMDLFSTQSDAMEAAIRSSVGAGVTYVVPDVSGFPTCDHTPSRMSEVITVSATKIDDERRTESLDVSCVNIFAPGTGIPSASNNSDDDTSIYYGNSWAAAHVAGVAALYLEIYPTAKPEEVFNALIAAATPNVITYNGVPFNEPPMLYSLAWSEGDMPPVADFTFTTNELTVTFTDLSYDPDGEVVAWEWDFGDNKTSIIQHPTHTYTAYGSYSVSLIVTDNVGETDSKVKSVTISEPELPGNNPPTILEFEVTSSTAGPWRRAHIIWGVADVDSDLVNVELELLSGTTVLDSANISVSGDSAFGSNELRSRTLPTDVRIVVTDSKGNSAEDTKSY